MHVFHRHSVLTQTSGACGAFRDFDTVGSIAQKMSVVPMFAATLIQHGQLVRRYSLNTNGAI